MKRICLVGAAAAALLTAGIPAIAGAASTRTVTKRVTVTQVQLRRKTTKASTTVHCTLSLATQIPLSDTTVLPGADSGKQAGKTVCGKSFGSGISHDSFTTDDAGNLSGSVQHWFNTGSMYGSYSLDSDSSTGPPTPDSFAAASYSGTVKITGGSGALRGVTGSGTLSCTTSDSAHFRCRETVKLTQETTAMVPVNVKRTVAVRVTVPVVTRTRVVRRGR